MINKFLFKKNKCKMPNYSLISKASEDKSFKRITKLIRLDKNDFVANKCSYLFDLSEPETAEKSAWHADWFIRLDNSYDQHDFELSWQFVKSLILDEKKASIVEFPLQYGFDVSEELKLNFVSTNPQHKYSLEFAASLSKQEQVEHTQSVDFAEKTFVKLVHDKQERVLPLLSSAFSTTKNFSYDLIKSNYTLKIKRNKDWELSIKYKLESNAGDCDFDNSLCGYTVNEEGQGKTVDVLHLPKHATFNAYEEKQGEQDFYLGVRTVSSEPSVISLRSPLIHVQNKKVVHEWNEGDFNNRTYALSFSYMMNADSADLIELNLISNRSDVRRSLAHVNKNSVRQVHEFSSLKSNLAEETTLNNLDECPLRMSSSMNNSLVWKRVENIQIFSCFDFNIEFKVKFDRTNKDLTTLPNVGFDQIQINSEESKISFFKLFWITIV